MKIVKACLKTILVPFLMGATLSTTSSAMSDNIEVFVQQAGKYMGGATTSIKLDANGRPRIAFGSTGTDSVSQYKGSLRFASWDGSNWKTFFPDIVGAAVSLAIELC